MCGISGFIDLTEKLSEVELNKMVGALSHRGPDSTGAFWERKNNCSVGLGHSRLSIIDTSSSGNQPMTINHLTIVFNGEIYNYKEIRQTLISQGETFSTNSDTEVILLAYKHWGRNCTKHFHGMWAFAIFDSTTREIVLCRDRLGVKPLFYYKTDRQLIFASELKSIKSLKDDLTIDVVALTSFFEYGYISQNECIYHECHKVPSGSWVTIYPNLSTKTEKYWDSRDQLDPDYQENLRSMSLSEIKKHVKEQLIQSFQLRTVSDVPIGVFLSGGVDSSLVTALLSIECGYTLNTFTIGFKESKFDEAHDAKFISELFNTKHRLEYLTVDDAKKLINIAPKIWDEPIGDTSIFPTYLVSNLASRHVKVSLSADGADELFLGYDRYKKLLEKKTFFPYDTTPVLNWIYNSIPGNLKHKREIIKRLRYLLAPDIVEGYKSIVSEFGHSNFKKMNLSKPELVELTNVTSLRRSECLTLFEINNYLQSDILYKVDGASMANSLESREPFLDQNIIKLALNLPLRHKYDSKHGKSILKNILSDYVPEHKVYKTKKGFGIPVKQWLNDDFKPLLEDLVMRSPFVHQPGSISNYVLGYVNNKLSYSERVWRFLMFELWKQEHNIHYYV